MIRETFRHRHLLSMEPFSRRDILTVLDLADNFYEIGERPRKKVPALRGKTIISWFLEPSTRTRTSFEIAGKRLSADVINISGSSSSTVKGESLLDTARNLEAMRPDIVILRHSASGSCDFLARRIEASVVNAGDGTHEHPTQALLDCATIRKHKKNFEGLVVAICGDLLHSRVARSNIHALTKLGAKVRVAGPRTMLPSGIEALGTGGQAIEVHDRLEPAITGADVVMMLRIQMERLGGFHFPTVREYSRYYGLNPTNVRLARPDAIIMHPGPMNRGVEIHPEVADGERSVILEQVTYGVAVRMAVLYLLAGAAEEEES